MKGSEKQALKIIKEIGSCSPERFASKIVMSAEYADELCAGLLDDGYLSKTGKGEYILTPEGEKVIRRTLIHGQVAILKGP
ncbi:MAG: hypothetical protein BA864_15715 [Desulfuromonadales bacterium C00003093]|nr:MAG: hypothetical protein BA864_15715 [Desulfuromonadales bacterium C00003093]